MGNFVFVIHRPARQVLATGFRSSPAPGGSGEAGVSSFNTRTGPVNLTSADVSEALGYTPPNSADLADVALSGAYADLSAKPIIPALPGDIGAATAAQGAAADTAVQPAALASSLAGKVDKSGDKVLSDENYTSDEKSALASLREAAGQGGGAVDSVNGQTGVVVLDTDDIAEGVSNLYFTNGRAAAAAPVQTVDGQTGAVSLSSSYAPLSHVGAGGAAHSNAVAAGAAGFMTGADKTKLDGIATGATANANTDSLSEGSTNKYFTEVRVLATLMTGLTLIAGGAVSAADSLLVAVGKLQKQINDLFSGKQDTLVSGTNIKTVNGATLLGAGDLVVTGGASLPVVQTFTGAKALGLADINTYNVSQDATAQVVTLPAQATVTWTDHAEIHIERGAAGTLTIVGATGVQINGTVAGTFTLGAKYSVVTLKRKASNLWTLFGNAS